MSAKNDYMSFEKVHEAVKDRCSSYMRSNNLRNKFSIMPVAYVVVSFRDFFFFWWPGIIQYTKNTFLVLLRGPFVFFSLCISCLLKQGRRLTVPILDALSRLDLDAELVAEVRAFTEHFSSPCLETPELELFLHSKYFAKSDSCRPSKVLSSWSWKEVRS